MKCKKLLSFFLSLVLLFSFSLLGCDDSKSSSKDTNEVKLCEVVRSIFYAPMYIAINKGFFEDEGLAIDLSTGQGADKVMQTVLSKNADIGLCGAEQTVYIHNQGRENYPVLFAQLTKKDGSFLVRRGDDEYFTWDSLKGKEIIGGRPGGIPEMALEHVLKLNGLEPGKDVKMVTNIDFTATAGAFKSGTADYVALFEPTASALELEGDYKIVASIGESSGDLAYTCFFSTKSYIDKNNDVIEKFSKAIYKGQEWFYSHSSEEIAKSIQSFFPGTDLKVMIKVIDNYKNIEALAKTPEVNEEDLNNLIDVIREYDSKLIPNRPDNDKMINNSFAKEAINDQD